MRSVFGSSIIYPSSTLRFRVLYAPGRVLSLSFRQRRGVRPATRGRGSRGNFQYRIKPLQQGLSLPLYEDDKDQCHSWGSAHECLAAWMRQVCAKFLLWRIYGPAVTD